MRPEFYQQVFSIQDTHWWGRNRRELSLDLLKRFGVPQRCQHLDIGCGTGQNLGLLANLAPSRVVGIDISPIALAFARKACPRCQLVRSDINGTLPFPDRTFDVATVFNVLYHSWVTSEVATLKQAHRVLKANGLLLVTEPAFPALDRELDVAAMAKRRYRLHPFVALLREAGFEVLFANYFTSFGAPIILAMKAMKTLAGKRPDAADAPDVRPMWPLLDASLYRLARIEAGLIKASLPMPFGTTIICVARRQ